MNIIITGKNIKVDDDLKNRIYDKIGKVEKFDLVKTNSKCNVVLRKVREECIIEVTIPLENKKIIRAEKRAKDFETALDMVDSTLTQQARKGKEKTAEKKRNVAEKQTKKDISLDAPHVVKEKTVELALMTADMAADEMESLDHDFHLYLDSNTGRPCVIYKRKDGNYGLLFGE